MYFEMCSSLLYIINKCIVNPKFKKIKLPRKEDTGIFIIPGIPYYSLSDCWPFYFSLMNGIYQKFCTNCRSYHRSVTNPCLNSWSVVWILIPPLNTNLLCSLDIL